MMQAAKQAAETHRAALAALPNVVSVGHGYKRLAGVATDISAVIVWVRKKEAPQALSADQMVPLSLGGVATDVVQMETRRIPIKLDPLSYTARERPVIGGDSIGHPLITAGTDGVPWGFDPDGTLIGLTNEHVGCPEWLGAKVGDPILQPGPYDGGQPGDVFAVSLAVSGVKMDGSYNSLDICKFKADPRLVARQIKGLGAVYPTRFGVNEPGKPIMKVGRSSELTRDTILAVGAALQVDYGTDATGKPLLATFVKQVETRSGVFIVPGDSGSAVLSEDGSELLGVAFAGGQTGFYNDIAEIVARMPFSVAQAPPPTPKLEDQVAEIIDKVSSVWAYYAGTWYAWIPGGGLPPGASDRLVAMQPGWGYWIKVKEPTSFSYNGNTYGPLSCTDQDDGWNLIGWRG